MSLQHIRNNANSGSSIHYPLEKVCILAYAEGSDLAYDIEEESCLTVMDDLILKRRLVLYRNLVNHLNRGPIERQRIGIRLC